MRQTYLQGGPKTLGVSSANVRQTLKTDYTFITHIFCDPMLNYVLTYS